MHKFKYLRRQVRPDALHRLRPLHPRLPRRSGPRRDPAGDRHRRPPPGRRHAPAADETRRGRLVNIYQPLLATVTELIDETARHAHAAPGVPGRGGARELRLPGRPVRRVLVLRRRREHLLHRLLADPRGLHRVQLQGHRQGHRARCAKLDVGDTVGVRGPYGNCFPMDDWNGKDLVFVAGGIALPPVRSVIWNCLDRRDKFGDITIVYGARIGRRPGLQARAGRVGLALRRQDGQDRRPRRRHAGLDRRGRLRPAGRREDGAQGGQHRRRGLRPARS